MRGNLLATGAMLYLASRHVFRFPGSSQVQQAFPSATDPRLSNLGALLDAVTQFRGFRLGRPIEAVAFDVEQPAMKRAALGRTRDRRRGAGNRNRAIRSGPFRLETARTPVQQFDRRDRPFACDLNLIYVNDVDACASLE